MTALLHRFLQLYRVHWFEPLYGSNLVIDHVIEPPLGRALARGDRSWPSATGQLLSNLCVELLALVVLCGLVVAPVAVLLLVVAIDAAGVALSESVLRLGAGSAAALGSLSLMWAAHNMCWPLRCREASLWNLGGGVSMRPLELLVFVTNGVGAVTVECGLILAAGHFAAAVATLKCGLAAAPWGLSAPGMQTLGWRVTVGLGVVQAATSVWLGATVQWLAGAKSIRKAFVSAMLPVPPSPAEGLACCCNYPEAAAARRLDRDVMYGPEPEQRLDIYHSRGQCIGCPVAVFVHGGGWISGDKRSAASFPMLVELRKRGWVFPPFRCVLGAFCIHLAYYLTPLIVFEQVIVALNHRRQVEDAICDISLAMEW